MNARRSILALTTAAALAVSGLALAGPASAAPPKPLKAISISKVTKISLPAPGLKVSDPRLKTSGPIASIPKPPVR